MSDSLKNSQLLSEPHVHVDFCGSVVLPYLSDVQLNYSEWTRKHASYRESNIIQKHVSGSDPKYIE